MLLTPSYPAIYDFGLLPYALGDVLTWNIQTAVRAAQAGRGLVDIYLCADAEEPAFQYQRGMVVEENAFLHLGEMLGAFGTHPCLGDINICRSRHQIRERLLPHADRDAILRGVLHEYQATLDNGDDQVKHDYFRRHVFSYAKLNEFFGQSRAMPLLQPSRGCEPDVEGVMTRLLAGKRVVVVHPRLRRLDYGLRGEPSHHRDSDFLEWYEFLRTAAHTHPEVQFVVVGRLQEKPIELLRLDNVISLRTLGFGLGHELTLLRRADLFIGTSSGFAVMANFSETPYFITRMTKEGYFAYGIPEGAASLPFAASNQILIRETETASLLSSLLDRGLLLPPRGAPPSELTRPTEVDPNEFSRHRSEWLSANATTSRYFIDDDYADQESAFLVAPHVAEGVEALKRGDLTKAAQVARRVNDNFPRMSVRYAQLRALANPIAPPLASQIIARTRAWLRQPMARVRSRMATVDRRVLPRALHGSVVHNLIRAMRRWALPNRR
jgi:hypothetical protein